MKKDLFRITYDAERVTPDQMLETVRKQGFRGKITSDALVKAAEAGKVRRDLAQLPLQLRKEVEKAKKENKLLLLAFHGPG